MHKRIKRILEYILIPIVIAVIGLTVIYVAARPVIIFASNMLGMIISDSAPEFKTELASIYEENADAASTGKITFDSINYPKYETHYAQLQCERLDMNVRVYWGDSDKVFREGAGQYIGSFIPGYGGLILLGAHDSMYFAPLEDVKTGDEFTIRTNYGVFKYKVTETKIGSDGDSEVFEDVSGETLVMYTCYPFGALIGVKNQRFYVFAEKISGPEIIRE